MKRQPTAEVAMFFVLFFASQSHLSAQELTDSKLKELFQRQIELFKAARKDPKLGATRGLVLTNVAPEVETDATPSAAAAPKPLAAEAAPAPSPATAAETAPAPASAAEPGQPTPSTAASPSSPPTVSTAAATDAPETYWELPPSDQVNVRVNFAFDSAAIAPKQRPKLLQLCAVIKEMDIKLVRIVGHTDAVGNAEYNQKLSMLRAKEVRRFFADDCQIAPERLEAVGVGEQFLFDAVNPKAGENRRVEFQAVS
jgi:OOP family OmpA-OmpF porin